MFIVSFSFSPFLTLFYSNITWRCNDDELNADDQTTTALCVFSFFCFSFSLFANDTLYSRYAATMLEMKQQPDNPAMIAGNETTMNCGNPQR
jgi:hypothetical protein